MANAPSGNPPSVSREAAPQAGNCPPDCDLPENSKENLDAKLDHAIEETFPTSDPVSVKITKGTAIDYDHPDDASPVEAERRDQADQDTAEHILDQVRASLSEVAGGASDAARSAYSEGQRFVHQARASYPEAEHYYQEGSRAIHQRLTENLWLSLLVAGAIGYGLAWMIHGSSRSRTERVPDYARTR
jgi:ElaB/YqjD/DUF883 family membrane-anchored ribosome-binding protein